MRWARRGHLPLIATLVACLVLFIAPTPAHASASRCIYDYQQQSTVCSTITGTGLYVNNIYVQVHVPSLPPWKGQFIGWVQPQGQDFASFTIVDGYAPNFTQNWNYHWYLNRSYPNNSQACAEFTTANGYYPVPQGPICFTIHS